MYDKSRQTDPNFDTPVFMSAMNAHFNILLQVLEERFTASDNQQDRTGKDIHTINRRLDHMEKDIHVLQTDVKSMDGRLDRMDGRLDRMETLMQNIIHLLQTRN